MKPAITLTRALTDPALFGNTFAAPSFWTWRAFAKLIDGIPLREPREIGLFKQCTGRSELLGKPAKRIILLAGRRAGKDRFFSAAAVWRAALAQDWKRHISAGEQAVCLLLGADKKQAAILRGYCEGLLQAPLLAPEVVRQTNEVIEFRNGASLEIATNDARLVRGRSAIAVFGSECCYWRTSEHASSSDEEVVGAAEPSMAMTPDGGLLLLGSSVHRKVGYMYRQYKRLYGQDKESSICWFATSETMNSQLPLNVVDEALADNAPQARAEFQNVWRDDLSDFVPADVVESCTDFGTYERPPEPGIQYVAYCDASSGVNDSFALAIAHKGSPNVLDLVRERKPRFVPSEVISEFAELLKSYGINTIQSDRYAVGFHEHEWQQNGIKLEACERTTSDNYLHVLPVLMAKRVRLLDNKTLRAQLASLERSVGSGDKESVSHPKHANAHDDVACAAAGAIALVAGYGRYRYPSGPNGMDWVSGPTDNAAAEEAAYLAQRMQRHVFGHGGFYHARRW